VVLSPLGSKHADCPILFVVTVPEFVSLGHRHVSATGLVEKALRGFPNNKVCRRARPCDDALLAAGLESEGAKSFPTTRARFAVDCCFSRQYHADVPPIVSYDTLGRENNFGPWTAPFTPLAIALAVARASERPGVSARASERPGVSARASVSVSVTA